MNDLQEAFVDAIEHLDLPEVDLTPAVLGRISGDQPDVVVEPDRGIRRVAVAAVAAAIAAIGLVMATTPAGDAVAAWFGIGATTFEVDDPAVDGNGADGTVVSDGTSSSSLDLGRQVQPTPDTVPIESLGRPDAVFDDARRGRTYLWDTDAGGQVRLSVRSTAESTFAVKSLASADDVEFLTVEVANEPGVPRQYPGVWVGAPHTLTYPVEGLDLELTVDAGPVLIWVNVDDGIELRLEGAGGRDEAVGYAVEVSGGTELLPPG